MNLPFPSTASRFFAAVLFAFSAAVSGAQTGGTAKKSSDTKANAAAAAAAAKDRAKKGGMSTSDLRKLFEEVSKQRDVMIADFEQLAKQLKDATDEEKKKIREKMEAQKKAFDEMNDALQKQIREEQRKQRQNPGPGKR